MRCAAKGCDRAPEIFQWCAVHAPAVEWIQKVADLRAALATAEAERDEVRSVLEWTLHALRGEEVSDFAASFHPVHLAQDLWQCEVTAVAEAGRYRATLEAERGVVVACTRRAEAAEARAQRAVEVLRLVEWNEADRGEVLEGRCPVCCRWRPGLDDPRWSGHLPDCALAAVLAERKGEHGG